MEGRLLTLKGGAVVSSTAPPAQGVPAPTLLAVDQLSKTFPGTRALDDVTLDLRSGRVTALVGHNGSGKSTLVKILAGVYEPDIDGCIADGEGSQRWRERIHFIHQDLGLIGDLNAVENLDLASTVGLRHLAPARTRAERASARALVARFGVELDVTTPIRNLSPAERSIVAIGRALQHWDDDQQVLVLDEPTASLQDKEVEVLLGVVTRIAERGAAVLYISHRLDEVEKLADDVVVLRDGQVVDRLERGSFTSSSLVESITGHAPENQVNQGSSTSAAADPALTIRGLTGPTLAGIDIDVSRGEIVGISGVIGSGIEDVLGSIFGAIPRLVETLDIGGQPTECTTPAAAVRAGMGFVPRDRHRHGAILEFPARENLTLPKLKPLRRILGGISGAREKAEAAAWFERADVRPGDPERRIAQFSGGNQQKVVLSKWIRNDPAVLLLEEPTQGVDAGAQDTIYRLIRDAAEHGAGVLVASSDTKELVRLCDRVLVLNRGRVVAELSGGDLTEHHLIRKTLASEPTPDMNTRETP